MLASAGRHQEAVAQFDRVIEVRPDIGNAHLNRGASLDELSLHDEAIDSYARAAELNPEDPRALFNRARTCYYLGRLQDALDDYTQVLRLDPEDAEAYNNRGLAYDALGDYESAVADYEQALTVRPDFAEAHSNRGAVLEAQGDVEEALEAYRQALAANPPGLRPLQTRRGCMRTRDLESFLDTWTACGAVSRDGETAAQDEHLRWALRSGKADTRGPEEGTTALVSCRPIKATVIPAPSLQIVDNVSIVGN